MTIDRRLLVAGLAILLVGSALGVGIGQFLVGGAGGEDGEPSAAPGTPPAPVDGTAQPPLTLRLESVEPCGQTCRDVTASLVNNQDREATNVTVTTRIYAGEDTGGDLVWSNTEPIGALGPGASTTEAVRVELSLVEAATVRANGGRVTIEIAIATARQTLRIVEHRDVA